MQRETNPPQKTLIIVYRIAVGLILLLLAVLLAGSLYALARPSGAGPLFRIGGRPQVGAQASDAEGVFTGIGRLRIPAAGQPPATVVLSISFPYSTGDRLFAEELASRISDFRTIAIDYFSSMPVERITGMDEEAAKADILRQYNALLRLGRIETLYFSDLMIIE